MQLLIVILVISLVISVSGAVLKESERQLFLDLHNKLRAELANGAVPNLPPAADMEQLVWDKELESLANERVDQCDYEHDRRDGHSDNLAYNTMRTREDAIQTALNDWWDEYKDYQYSDTFDDEYSYSLHFTQMAHAKTNRLGCALAEGCHTSELPKNSTLIRCQYAPWGNIVGDSVYTSGAACTKCARGEICAQGALCAAIPAAASNATSNNVNRSSGGVQPTDAPIDDNKRTRRPATTQTQTNTDKRVSEAEMKNGTRDASAGDFVNVPDKAKYVITLRNFASRATTAGSETATSNKWTDAVDNTVNGTAKKNYYCYTRVPSICELASKYSIYQEPSLKLP